MAECFQDDLFTLVQCKQCDLVFLGQELSSEDFRLMYQDSLQFNGSVYRQEDTVKAAQDYYGSCYNYLLSDIGLEPSEARLLEVGAGRAWMCMVAQKIGKSQTVAQDVTAECALECPWVDTYVVGDISDPRISTRAPYDIISLTHVIEHVPNPIAMLKALKALMHKTGRVFVTAPHRPPKWSANSSIGNWETWAYHHVPGHLQYFSERAMAAAAIFAGLELIRWVLHEDGQAFEAVLKHGDMA